MSALAHKVLVGDLFRDSVETLLNWFLTSENIPAGLAAMMPQAHETGWDII